MNKTDTSKREIEVSCPQCRKKVAWHGNPFRPFCSERCKLIDLGKWAEGEYSIPGQPAPGEEEENES